MAFLFAGMRNNIYGLRSGVNWTAGTKKHGRVLPQTSLAANQKG